MIKRERRKESQQGEAVTVARCQAKLANLMIHIWITKRQVQSHKGISVGIHTFVAVQTFMEIKDEGILIPCHWLPEPAAVIWWSLSLCDDFMEDSEDAGKWWQSDVHELMPSECFMVLPLWGIITIWNSGEVSRPSWMDGPHWLRFLIIS